MIACSVLLCAPQRLQHVDHYQSMCRRLFCAVPWDPTAFQAIFAMEKTTCGDGKVSNSCLCRAFAFCWVLPLGPTRGDSKVSNSCFAAPWLLVLGASPWTAEHNGNNKNEKLVATARWITRAVPRPGCLLRVLPLGPQSLMEKEKKTICGDGKVGNSCCAAPWLLVLGASP